MELESGASRTIELEISEQPNSLVADFENIIPEARFPLNITSLSFRKNTMTASENKAPSHFKPGQTINKHERHYVVHNYHDYANEPDDPAKTPIRRRKGGVTTPFPIVLHRVIAQVEADGLGHVFGWQPHGRCFVIFKPKEFVNNVLPKYFNLNKLSSFQRQLNLYGFSRITRGLDASGYYHEYFLRDREFLAKRMMRKRIKGTKIKGAYNPDLEPDFYLMPPVGRSITPHITTTSSPNCVTSDSSSSNEDKSLCSSSAGGDDSTSNDNDNEKWENTDEMIMSMDRSAKTLDLNSDELIQDVMKPVCNFVFPTFFQKQIVKDENDETFEQHLEESQIEEFIVDFFEAV